MSFPAQGLASRLLDALSSLRTSIGLLTLIILYSAIGSAVPPVRQYFELSEGGWFAHRVFGAMVLLLALSVIVATARRIRFNLINLGVIAVHTGVLLLIGGSFQYFGGKIEGDVLLAPPSIQIYSKARLTRQEDSAQIGQIVAVERRAWDTEMPMIGGHYRVEVTSVRHDGMNTAAEVGVRATFGDPPRTEEFVLKQGAPENAFRSLNDHVVLALSRATRIDRFFDGSIAALEVRPAGRASATFALPRLPRYMERFDPTVETIKDTAGQSVRTDRTAATFFDAWSMPIALVGASAPQRATSSDWPIDVEIDGFLPYADLRESVETGGDALRPVARLRLRWKEREEALQLEAMRPGGSLDGWVGGSTCEFRWLEDSKIPAEWTESLSGSHVLSVALRDPPIRRRYDISEGQTIEVEGSGYSLQVDRLMPVWPLISPGFEGARSPVAQVTVTGGGKRYQRTVIERYPQLSQDIDEKGVRHRDGPYDPNLLLVYKDCSAHSYTLAAGPDLAPVVIHTAPGGARTLHALKTGETFSPAPDSAVTLTELIEKPRSVLHPVVVPYVNRRQNMMQGRDLSLVRVKLTPRSGGAAAHAWVPFTPYGYFGDRKPVTAAVRGFGDVELIFGRMQRPLPGDITLEQMEVQFNPGRNSVRDWRSRIRTRDGDDGAVLAGGVWLNHTSQFGPWTLFQSGAAPDHESWTVLGVGNRRGILPMVAGCILIALGLLYAFYVKPTLIQRRKDRATARNLAARGGGPLPGGLSAVSILLLVAVGWLAPSTARAQEPAPSATASPETHAAASAAADSEGAQAVQSLGRIVPQLDLKAFGLLVVQHNSRYQTVEAWARDVVKSVHGSTDLDGLDPIAAALELSFNADAHIDRDILYIKEMGVRHDLTSYPVSLPEQEQNRIRRTGMVSYRFLRDPAVAETFDKLKTLMPLQRAVDRVEMSRSYFERARSTLKLLPEPSAAWDAGWHTIDELAGNVGAPPREGATPPLPVPGVSVEQARPLLRSWLTLADAWRRRDAAAINAQLAELSAKLPTLAGPGVYPSESQRRMEALYFRAGAFTWGWGIYIVGLVLSIWAVVTGWRPARGIALAVFLVAFGLHALGLGLRWFIVGRIPVANMFEAVVASAWIGAALALGLEWRLLRAWQVVYLIPAVVAVVLQQRYETTVWKYFAALASAGLVADMANMARRRRSRPEDRARGGRGFYVLAACFLGFLSLALGNVVGSEITSIAGILDDVLLRIHTVLIITSYAIVTLAFGVANCYLLVRAVRHGTPAAAVTLGAQVGAGLGLYLGLYSPSLVTAGGGAVSAAILLGATAGGALGWGAAWLSTLGARGALSLGPGAAGLMSAGAARSTRRFVDTPLLAGLDLSQLTLVSMANVGLFVGTMLGAVWADYSWGRPWGWDPKEVFALNTWLIYAILIHVRLLARDKGLWTSIVAVIGFAMMMFNWWAVNFYIVGLHSYA